MISKLKIFLNYLYISVFVGVLVFPYANSRLNIINDFEFTEKRTLVQKPGIAIIGANDNFIGIGSLLNQLKSYPELYEQYMADNLDFRNKMIAYNKLFDFKISRFSQITKNKVENIANSSKDLDPINREIDMSLFDSEGYLEGNTGSDKAILTDDNWWWKVIPGKWRVGDFTQQELENYAKEIQARSDYLKKKGIVYVYGVYPGKRTVYPEYLPEGAKSVNMRGRQILEYLETYTDVITVDPYDAIIEEKDNKAKEGKIIYKKTDTHWNSDGAFVGYTEVANVVKQYVDISVSTKDDFDINYENTKGGDIVKMVALENFFEETNLPVYRDNSKCIETLHQYPVSGSDKYAVFKNNCIDLDNSVSAVIFGDSYTAVGNLPFWKRSFSNLAFKREYIGFDTNFINTYSPDIVIQAIVDYDLYEIVSDNYTTPELY